MDTPVPQDSAIKRLDVFAGKWILEGEQYAGPVGPEAEVDAVETYEWLQGGKWMVHRFDGHVGKVPAACIEIIGYDAQAGSYPSQTFYDNGILNKWNASVRDRTWIVTGNWDLQGKVVKVRCTTTFNEAGDGRAAKWESSADGVTWDTFWDVKAKKVG
jgi:hypothetical protein